MTPPAHHFLVTYGGGRPESVVEDLGTDVASAMAEFKARERAVVGTEDKVVLLGADSLETLKRTHSSYFGPTDTLVAALRGL